MRAIALYRCNGEDQSELSFQAGDIIYKVMQDNEPGWYSGELLGKRGLFPGNYVRFEEDPTTSTDSPRMMNAGPTNEILIAAGVYSTPKLNAHETRRQLHEKSSSILSEFTTKSLDRGTKASEVEPTNIWDKSKSLNRPPIPTKPVHFQEEKKKPLLPSRPSQEDIHNSVSPYPTIQGDSSVSTTVSETTAGTGNIYGKRKPPPPPKKPDALISQNNDPIGKRTSVLAAKFEQPAALQSSQNNDSTGKRTSVLAAKFEQMNVSPQSVPTPAPKPALPIFQTLERFNGTSSFGNSSGLTSRGMNTQSSFTTQPEFINPFAEIETETSMKRPAPLPPRPAGPKIPRNVLNRYTPLFESFSRPTLPPTTVASIWLRSQIEPKILGTIWNMLKKTRDNHLDRNEFLIGF